MLFKTRFFYYLTQLLNTLKGKVLTIQKAFSLVLLSLFTGFVFGNLFGTFLDTFRLYFLWNGFIGLFILLFIELLNSFVYGISCSKKVDYLEDLKKGKGGFLTKLKVTTGGLKSSTELPDVNNYLLTDTTNPPVSTSGRQSRNRRGKTLVNSLPLRDTSFLPPKGKRTTGYVTKKFANRKLLAKSSNFRKLVLKLQTKIFFCGNSTHIKRILNSFKIGLLFGFFVDSFKVGS